MGRHDYDIELFVFPDGTSIEMLVFRDGHGGRREETSYHARRSDAAGGTAGDAASQAEEAATGHMIAEEATALPAPTVEETGVANVCPLCRCDLVYPVDWQRNSAGSWNLELRCPNCETRREVTMDRARIEQLNRALYHGAQAMARETERVSRRNFEEQAARLVKALAADLILPMDF